MENTPSKSTNKLNGVLIASGVSLLVIGAGVGIYFLLKKRSVKIEELEDHSENNPVARQVSNSPIKQSHNSKIKGFSSFSCTNKSYPLKYGTCHPDVEVLQKYLKQMYQAELGTSGMNKNGIDGKFGAATKRAALKYLNKSLFTPKDIRGIKTALKFIPA